MVLGTEAEPAPLGLSAADAGISCVDTGSPSAAMLPPQPPRQLAYSGQPVCPRPGRCLRGTRELSERALQREIGVTAGGAPLSRSSGEAEAGGLGEAEAVQVTQQLCLQRHRKEQSNKDSNRETK